MNHTKHIFIIILILSLLQACAGSGVAPVSDRKDIKKPSPGVTQRGQTNTATRSATGAAGNEKGFHVVKQGDTLYSIAWRYHYDYKHVAKWNKIRSPYTIYPGQFIRLKPIVIKKGAPLIADTTEKSAAAKPLPKPVPPPAKQTEKKQIAVAKKEPQKTYVNNGPIKWSWPTPGKLIKSNSPTLKKGIDITGSERQTINAAAAGEVVYSGSGLLGYGKLIIIKHNESFLSAYAYNSELFVKEGDKVLAGQKISIMGKDNAGRNVLHFEIRQNGKPVDPIKYLPKQHA